MNLATLPVDFPLLTLILEQISGDKVGLPPDTRSIGRELIDDLSLLGSPEIMLTHGIGDIFLMPFG